MKKKMKKIIYFLILILIIISSSCQKNMLEEVEEGNWNRDKNIVEITFENQIGLTTISRNEANATVEFKYNLGATGSLQVPIKSLVASYGTTIDAKAGDILDFDNPDNSATLTVTSAKGETLDWTIKLTPFIEELEGKWNINFQEVYGGTGPQYGGAAIHFLEGAGVAAYFDPETGPKAELDNIIEFKLIGFTDEGNSYGDIINNPGSDGKYADYYFKASGNLPAVDVNKFYRIIPTEGGTWLHDFAQNLIIIRFSNGNEVKLTLNPIGYIWSSPTYDTNQNTKNLVFNSVTLARDLNAISADVWHNGMYTPWNRIAIRPYMYWIGISKAD